MHKEEEKVTLGWHNSFFHILFKQKHKPKQVESNKLKKKKFQKKKK